MNNNRDTIFEDYLEEIIINAPWTIEDGFQILERQKKIDVGIIDIFGKDKDDKFVIVELKRDKASDVVVGQISRYIGAIQALYHLDSSQVRGIIVCKKADKKLHYAASVIPNLIIQEFGDEVSIEISSELVGFNKAIIPIEEAMVLIEIEAQIFEQLELKESVEYQEIGFQIEDNHTTGISLAGMYRNFATLSSIPTEIGHLSYLEYLGFDNNSIKEIPLSLTNLQRLQMLQLDRNRITTLPFEIGSIISLESLSLSNNQIELLPDSIGNLSQLIWLDLSNNRLKSLPDNIGKLSNLEDLDLSFNLLRKLPSSIGNLNGLKRLGLNDNELQALPDTMQGLEDLKELYLHGNSIQIPSWFVEMEKITDMSLDKTYTLPDLGTMNVRNLSLYKVEEIPKWILYLSKLESLDIQSTFIRELPLWFDQFENLKSLNLYCSKFTSIPEVVLNLENLERLKLICPNLNYLSESIASLPNLEFLTVGNIKLNNQIRRSLVKLKNTGINCYFENRLDTLENDSKDKNWSVKM